jgi:cysteine desulfurase
LERKTFLEDFSVDRIYLDHSATTPLDTEVFSAMMPYFYQYFGNASSIYREGQKSREAIDDARLTISQILSCSLEEIIFTSGATESNNLALRGVIDAWKKKFPSKVPHIITSSIEHSSIRNVLLFFEEEGIAQVSFLSVNTDGIVDLEELKKTIRKETVLVSIMAVNNEIGSLQPISRIGRLCKKNNLLFHVDAVQAIGYFPVSCEAWKCDLLSLSAHKFYGPKGVGILFVRSGTEIIPQILGGGQERKYRSGTENVGGIVGMAKALEKSELLRESEASRLRNLQSEGKELLLLIPGSKWNGPDIGDFRTPANLHVSFGEIDGESLLIRLDLEGVAVSLGSACSSGLLSPSHVLLAIGCSEEDTRSGIRITMGRSTTEENLKKAIEKIALVVEDLRKVQGYF